MGFERRTRRRFRRGGLYLAVLSTSVAVALLGMTALALVRVDRTATHAAADFIAARLKAESAVEMALMAAANDANWKTTLTSWPKTVDLGSGSMWLSVSHPEGAGEELPALLTGYGYRGDARFLTSVLLQPSFEPMEVLRSTLHTGLSAWVLLGRTGTFTGGPFSCNGTLTNNGSIVGNVEALLYAGLPPSGTLTLLAAQKPLPSASVIDTYASGATTLPYSSNFERLVVTPLYTPWGNPNSSGRYLIDTGGQDMTIRGCRFEGTLIVRATNRQVRITDAVLMTRVHESQPVLLVDGSIAIEITSSTPLRETTWSTNFNPHGAPYGGQSDTDMSDSYENVIRGLVFATGSVTFSQAPRVEGVVISRLGSTIFGNPTIVHLPEYYNNPPEGFRKAGPPRVVPAGWRRELIP